MCIGECGKQTARNSYMAPRHSSSPQCKQRERTALHHQRLHIFARRQLPSHTEFPVNTNVPTIF